MEKQENNLLLLNIDRELVEMMKTLSVEMLSNLVAIYANDPGKSTKCLVSDFMGVLEEVAPGDGQKVYDTATFRYNQVIALELEETGMVVNGCDEENPLRYLCVFHPETYARGEIGTWATAQEAEDLLSMIREEKCSLTAFNRWRSEIAPLGGKEKYYESNMP